MGLRANLAPGTIKAIYPPVNLCPMATLLDSILPTIQSAEKSGFKIVCARLVVTFPRDHYEEEEIKDQHFILKSGYTEHCADDFFYKLGKRHIQVESNGHWPIHNPHPGHYSTVWLVNDQGEAAWIASDYSEYDGHEKYSWILKR